MSILYDYTKVKQVRKHTQRDEKKTNHIYISLFYRLIAMLRILLFIVNNIRSTTFTQILIRLNDEWQLVYIHMHIHVYTYILNYFSVSLKLPFEKQRMATHLL